MLTGGSYSKGKWREPQKEPSDQDGVPVLPEKGVTPLGLVAARVGWWRSTWTSLGALPAGGGTDQQHQPLHHPSLLGGGVRGHYVCEFSLAFHFIYLFID